MGMSRRTFQQKGQPVQRAQSRDVPGGLQKQQLVWLEQEARGESGLGQGPIAEAEDPRTIPSFLA